MKSINEWRNDQILQEFGITPGTKMLRTTDARKLFSDPRMGQMMGMMGREVGNVDSKVFSKLAPALSRIIPELAMEGKSSEEMAVTIMSAVILMIQKYNETEGD